MDVCVGGGARDEEREDEPPGGPLFGRGDLVGGAMRPGEDCG